MGYEKQKKIEGKKMRDDKEKVQEILFALFEKHQYYNIKDLVTETRQPAAYLKEILKEVCDYNVRQPHRNMWESKRSTGITSRKRKSRRKNPMGVQMTNKSRIVHSELHYYRHVKLI